MNTNAIAEYTATEAALADLTQRFKGVVYDVTTTKGLDDAKRGRAELRTLRTDLEKKRVEIKGPALERCRLIDAEAKRITAAIAELEDPIDAQIKAEEKRKEEERAAKIKAEAERVAGIRGAIAELSNTPLQMIGKSSAEIQMALSSIESTPIDDFYAEFFGEAQAARIKTIDALRTLLAGAVAAEAAAVAAKAQAEADAKARAEEEQRLAAVRAEQARIEEANRLAREKLEADERAARERIAAEQKRLEAEAERLRALAAKTESAPAQAPGSASTGGGDSPLATPASAADTVVAHQDEISEFLNSRKHITDKVRQSIRPWLVEFVKFQAARNVKQAA